MVTSNQVFRIGAWTVDPAALVLRNGDVTVHLRPKVMELLAVFAERPGEVLCKEELLDLVWPEVTVGDASLTVAVGELREALGDRPDTPEYIETIARRGYRFIAPVSKLQAGTPARECSLFWILGAGLELALRQGENLIGRGPEAHVRIESSKVSRQHARITVDGDTAMVEDLGSKNGTFVGKNRVTGPTPLHHGDQLLLGQLAAILSITVASHESTVTELSREVEIDTS